MEAFGKLKEEHEKHDRYLEFVCRLSKVAIDIGLADFVDDWLRNNFDLDSPTPPINTEEDDTTAAEVDGAEDPEEVDVKDLKRPVVPAIFGKIPTKI